MYLVRHGQTRFNALRKIQGACDSPLTEKGIKQATALRKYFEKIKIDNCYCSTSERTSDTLELITKQPYTRLKQLKEMDFGLFEGESENLNPARERYNNFFVDYGGEAAEHVEKRMVECCTKIMAQAENQQVLVVSHGGACTNFLNHWTTDSEMAEILKNGVGNCNIFEYEFDQMTKEFKFVDLITEV